MATQFITHINVAVLFVAELERSRDFYRDTIGIPVKFEDDVSAAFDLDPVLMMIVTREAASDLLSAGIVGVSEARGVTSQLVSFVDDVDAIYTELVAKGVDFVREPVDREWGLRTAHFRDPDGNVWELAQEIDQKSGR